MNEKIQELEVKRSQVNNQIRELTTKRQSIEQELAELKCPFHVGQAIINGLGQKAEVSAIVHTNWGDGYEMHVRKFKKNGDLYLNSQRVWQGERAGWVPYEEVKDDSEAAVS